MALSVWVLLMRPCRATYLHPILGPMMRMVFLMAYDVVIVGIFGTLLSTTAAGAMVVLFKPTGAAAKAAAKLTLSTAINAGAAAAAAAGLAATGASEFAGELGR
ncbi:hypothetical protein T492DRAFT_129453 [Pavlovales sp. CCMP2436]|nr:hypothetical protein T492DRAFT_129453 [Pavlovales sp. CCMP2436]